MSHPLVHLGVRLHLLTLVPRRGERGASLVEYALLVALIALVCVAAVATFGSKTNSSYQSISQLL
jgi:Flp pilus assembly pilin Flp